MSCPPFTVKDDINAVVDRYTELTEKNLIQDPLAIEIQQCNYDSATAICLVLQKHVQAFHDHSELTTCIKAIVENLYTLSTSPALREDESLRLASALSPVQLVFFALNILLATKMDAANRSANREALVDLFQYVENVLKRLKFESDVIVTAPMTQTLVRIMSELVSIFAVATKQVTNNEGPLGKYASNLTGESNVERILLRLDRLSPVEARAGETLVPTLEVIYVLVHNLRLIMEGENALTRMQYITRALSDLQLAVEKISGVARHNFQKKVSAWLSPPDTSTNHNNAHAAHYDGTAIWFTEGQIFKEWDKTGGLLWIHGKPGSGKTVLCSTIVELAKLMRNTGLATVGYFYVNALDPDKQRPRGLLSSLLTQLSSQSDRLCDILSPLYEKHERGLEQPSEDVLVRCLREALEDPNQAPVFIVVDALDEFSKSEGTPNTRQRALDIVKELVELNLPHLHFCFTSRPEIDIQEVLDPLRPYGVSLHGQQGQIDDIAKYIEKVVLSNPRMRGWLPDTKELVMKTLLKNCDGMFKWASCQLDTLSRTPLQAIPATLKALPRTLDETYERTLSSLDEEKWEFARRIFQFLTISVRPLRARELAEVFAISIHEEMTGIPEFNPSWREPGDPKSVVLSTCSSLIVVHELNGEQVVQFSHLSVKEFLTSIRLEVQQSTQLSRYYVRSCTAHTIFAKACLSILLQLDDHIHKDRVKEVFPLAAYAAEHWVVHAQRGDVSSLIEGMKDLFDKDQSHFAAWIWVYNIDNPSGPQMDTAHPEIPKTSPLYYAALCGFEDLVKFLIESRLDGVNSIWGHGSGTPLHAALFNGHSDVALFLLQNGAEVNARDSRGETPLHIASRRGDVEAARLLLKFGVDLKGNTETLQSQASALHVAAENDHHDVADFLLDNNANVDAQDRNYRTPLHVAATHGSINVTKLLIQRAASVDAKDSRKQTPLHTASSCGQEKIAQVLLDNGAHVDAANGGGWTALHLAAYNGHLNVVRLLLTRNAALDIENNKKKKPFQLALDSQIAQTLEEAEARSTCKRY